MAIAKFKDLASIRQRHKNKKIVFCSGVFDFLHPGHVLFFEDCKKQGDILFVAIGDDQSIKQLKGPGRPIMNQHMRLRLVDSLRPVDYVLVGPPPVGHPFSFMEKVLAKLKPDKYVLNNDAFDMPYREKMARESGAKLVVLKRKCPKKFEEVSTTKLIERIKNL